MIEIKEIRYKNINCFLIIEGSNCILVDTGSRRDREKILNKLKEYNIILIILTHGHIENIDNAKFFAEYFHAKIGMHKKDLALAQDSSVHPIYNDTYWGALLKKIHERKSKNFKIDNFNVDMYLDDNFSLEIFNVNAKILALPGHTNGSIGVLVDSNNLIVGDTLMNIITPTPSPFAEDFEKLKKSIQKINELKVNKLYVTHGNPISAEKFFYKYTEFVKDINPFA